MMSYKKFITIILCLWAGRAFALTVVPSNLVGTSPVSGSVLQTNGVTSTWATTSSLGISGVLSTSSAITQYNFPYWATTGGALSGTSTLSQSGTFLLQGGALNASGTITQNGTAAALQGDNLSEFVNNPAFITNASVTAQSPVAWSSTSTITCLTCLTTSTGLVVANFATSSISQWNNNSLFLTNASITGQSPWITWTAGSQIQFVNNGFITAASSVTWTANQTFQAVNLFSATTTLASTTIFIGSVSSTEANSLIWANSSGIWGATTTTFISTSTGLVVANFASPNISQWTNNSNFITFASSGSFTAALNLNNIAAATATLITDAGGNKYSTTTLSNPVTVAQGGTNKTSFTAGSIVFASGTAVLGENNGNLFWDNVNNRLGIGTTGPGKKLEVAGGEISMLNAAVDTGGSIHDLQLLGSSLSSPIGNRLTFGTDGSGWDFRIAKNQVGTVSDLVTVKDSGNVGIATTSPAYALDVVGTIRGTTLLGSYSGTISAPNVTAGAFASGNFAFQSSLGVATTTNGTLPQSLSVYGGGYFSGSVGVGTSTPGAKLHISTNGGATAPIGISDIQVGGVSWTIDNGFVSGVGASPGTFGIRGGTSGNSALVINSSGNVGIGTTTPSSILHIDQSSGPIIRLTRSNVSGARFDIQTDGTNMSLGPRDSGDLVLTSGAFATAVTIKSGGNVGVGTVQPSSTLHVAGASSTIRIGTGGSLPGCIELYDAVNSSTINYIYSSSTALIVTATKPQFCQ